MLDFIRNMKFYEADDGNGDGTGTGDNGNNEETNDNEETPYKSFKDESEYLNTLKSERSKAKNEVLKELGISSVDEAKQKFTKAGELESELTTYKTKTSELEEQLTLTKHGVKDDYAEEALALAKSKVNDEKDLSTALGEVLKKFPTMASKTQTVKPDVGGDKGNDKEDKDDQGKIKENLQKKYPWLKV